MPVVSTTETLEKYKESAREFHRLNQSELFNLMHTSGRNIEDLPQEEPKSWAEKMANFWNVRVRSKRWN